MQQNVNAPSLVRKRNITMLICCSAVTVQKSLRCR